jgi:hypothetical protein
MFEPSMSVIWRKKRRHVDKKRVDDFTKGNFRQKSYRKYSKSKIHAVELEV